MAPQRRASTVHWDSNALLAAHPRHGQLAIGKAVFVASLLPPSTPLDSLGPHRGGEGTMNNVRLGLIAAALLLALGWSAQAETVDAIWKTQRIAFYYGSRTSTYSCSSLTHRIANILRRVGAAHDLQVVATACDDSVGLARVEVRFSSPVPATTENLHAATHYDATQLLERFGAEWQTISFARDPKLKLAPGDCDLVRQMLAAVFSRMAIRIENQNLWCSQFGSALRPRLTVAALVKSEIVPSQ
jgi:hypothetical protein